MRVDLLNPHCPFISLAPASEQLGLGLYYTEQDTISYAAIVHTGDPATLIVHVTELHVMHSPMLLLPCPMETNSTMN